jgi:hypothetical protein
MAVSDTIFTYGPANVTSLLATTLSKYSKKMADNIFSGIPLLAFLGMKNRITEDGGATLIRPIMYSKNNTAASYSADDVLNTTIQDPYTAAQWQWRQYAASVAITGRIERQNSGDSQVIDYVTAQIQHAELSLKDLLDRHLFLSAQTGPNVTPLPGIINNTGTVGDINGGTYSWWQSNVTSSAGSFSASGLSNLRNSWNSVNILNPQGPVDLILSDQNTYQYYEATLVPAVRITDVEMGDLGFQNLKYKTCVWTFDPNATAGVIWGINSKAMELVQHSRTQFVLSEWVKPADQDMKVAEVLWMGELTTNNRRKLFEISGVTA